MTACIGISRRVGSLCFLGMIFLATAAIVQGQGQDLGESGGLTPAQERELKYADKLLAEGLADYSRAVIADMTLPPEILDIRKIKNYGAMGEFEKAKAIIAQRPGDSQEAWTLRLALADAYYMWGKYDQAQAIYDSFFKKFPEGPKPSLKGFYLASAYKYAQMMLMMDKRPPAAQAYRMALKAKPPDHVKRQLQSELAELLLRMAEDRDAAQRKPLVKEAQKLIDDILWIQDLWFGRGIVMLAQMRMMNNDIEGAMALIDDYRDQLKGIDEALKESSARTGEDMTKLSPMAQCRYMIGVILHDEAKAILKAGGDRQKALDLLIGQRKPNGKRSSGALQHFLNVFIRYPNTTWAPDAGNRFRQVEETLKQEWDKEVKAKITPEQWKAVEIAQFREARALYNQQHYEDAVKTYEQVLALFPERETSISAMGELAISYMELEEYMLCDVVIRHLAERFCRHDTLMTKAGDQIIRIAFEFSKRNLHHRRLAAYDTFFRYFKDHPRTPSELYRFAEKAFVDENLGKALDYYKQIVKDHADDELYYEALSKIAFVYSKQEKAAAEVKALQLLIKKLEAADKTNHLLVNATFRFANALKDMGPKYLPLAISKYKAIEKMLGSAESRKAYQKNADEAESNLKILQAVMFYRAMADCMRKTVPKNVQAYFDKKYKQKVPPKLILKTYYKAGAIKRLLKLVEQFPKSEFAPVALSQAGTLYTVLEKPDKARQTLQLLQKEYPESSEAEMAAFTIGMSLLKMDMRREAVAYFKEMFAGDGDYSSGQLLTAGRELAKAGEYKIAIEAFDGVIAAEDERRYLEPARTGKGLALCELKEYEEGVAVLNAVLEQYENSAYTVEICRASSQGLAALASKEPDSDKRFEMFNKAVSQLRRAKQYADDIGTKTELGVVVARILERKMEAEQEFGEAEKAEQYRNDAVAAYQSVIMFRDPSNPESAPHIQDAYARCLPLLLEMERWNTAMEDADRYLKLFPDGKHALEVRQYKNRARVSGGTETTPEEPAGAEPAAAANPPEEA